MKKTILLLFLLSWFFPGKVCALKTEISNVANPAWNNQAKLGEVIRYRIDFKKSEKKRGPYQLLFDGQISKITPFHIDSTISDTTVALYFLLETGQFPANLTYKTGINPIKLDLASGEVNFTKAAAPNFKLILPDAAISFSQSVWQTSQTLQLQVPAFFFDRLPSSKKDLRLYCNGVMLDSAVCSGIVAGSDTVALFFDVNNLEFARRFYKKQVYSQLYFGLGDNQESKIASENKLKVAFMKPNGEAWFWASFMGLAILMIWLGAKTDMLKDAAPDGTTKTFSLSRTQLAFWTFWVLNALIYLLLTTKTLSALPNSVFILLGISAAVTVASQTQEPKSESMSSRKNCTDQRNPVLQFFRELLSDQGGIKIERLQHLLFTLFFGAYFWFEVMSDLAIPNLDTNLLVLMGVSGVTYTVGKGMAGK